MPQTEAQTRKDIIDQRLKKAGWDVNDPAQVTAELDIWVGLPEGIEEAMHDLQGHQFADYVLLGQDGYPLAVVEAKKSSKDSRIGQEQARQYAENIAKNAGREVPFVFYTNGHDIYSWDTEKYPPRKVYGFPTRHDLERLRFSRQSEKPLSQELINTDIASRPYQIEAIRTVLEGVDKAKRKFLLVMATGTGKTRTCVAMIDVLMRANRIQRVLFLVDRIALRNQALDAFKEYLPNAPIWPKEGEKEITTDRRVYATTYQTMLSIIENTECPLSPHFFDIIVADESHRSIYNVYRNILDYFDAIQVGLTATPTDSLEHNTFHLFNCDSEMPDFAYSYEEAINNNPPYLSDFEVLRIKSKFQKEGIRHGTIPVEEQKKLLADGKEPTEIDYEGTDLEKKVTNKGTNALIVQEFMEECIKDSTGTLPGKTIFFAMTQKHARRLEEVFNDLYPEHKGQLAKVIVSDDSRVHGKWGLLDQFTNNDMPRIAISVDMLDTGIDVREITNLVFAKPVFSYTKFWQMIGRGTRLLDPIKKKPWCSEKDKFLVIDCWDNFEYFQMNPKGKEEKPTKPMPVRLFEARLQKLNLVETSDAELYKKTLADIQRDITKLPGNNVVILEAKSKIEKLDDNFWRKLWDEEKEYLRREIGPLMRTRTGEDFDAMSFEINVTNYAIAKLQEGELQWDKYDKKMEMLVDVIKEKVSDLPLSVNIVAKEKDLVEAILNNGYVEKSDDAGLDVLIQKIAPLMRFREEGIKPTQDSLDLRDVIIEKEYIEFGPHNERLTIQKYREKVEALVKKLAQDNEILQRVKQGWKLDRDDLEELATTLMQYEPYPTEKNLQKAYDARQVHFIDLIKHIMGMGDLITFPEKVSVAFSEFIATHNALTAQQIRFIQTLQTFIIQNGKLEKQDLIKEPFTLIHRLGIRGLFTPREQTEILTFTSNLLTHA